MGLSSLKRSIINSENNIKSNVKNTEKTLCIVPNNEIMEILNSPVKKTVYLSKTALVVCKICGRNYHRNNVTAHRKTKVHQAYFEMNEKIRELLLPNKEN